MFEIIKNLDLRKIFLSLPKSFLNRDSTVLKTCLRKREGDPKNPNNVLT